MVRIRTLIEVDEAGHAELQLPGEIPPGAHEIALEFEGLSMLPSRADLDGHKPWKLFEPIQGLRWDPSVSLRRSEMYEEKLAGKKCNHEPPK